MLLKEIGRPFVFTVATNTSPKYGVSHMVFDAKKIKGNSRNLLALFHEL